MSSLGVTLTFSRHFKLSGSQKWLWHQRSDAQPLCNMSGKCPRFSSCLKAAQHLHIQCIVSNEVFTTWYLPHHQSSHDEGVEHSQETINGCWVKTGFKNKDTEEVTNQQSDSTVTRIFNHSEHNDMWRGFISWWVLERQVGLKDKKRTKSR